MATPPFNISENEPSPSSFISQYPTNEQTFRDIVESWLTMLSDPATGLLNPTAFPTPFELESTDAGADTDPVFSLYRNSATPAAADFIGEIEFNGEDSAGNKTLYGQMYGQIADPTNGSEDGTLGFSVSVAGTLTSRMTLSASGASVSGAMAATGAVSGTTGTFSSTVTSGQIFISTSTNPIFASPGGTMFFRPGGSGVSTGQMTLATSGALSVAAGVSATTGTFSGAISGTTGTFSGAVSMAGLTATTGSFSGAVTSGGAVTSSQNFIGGTSVVLAGAGGNVLLRPNGAASGTGQMVVSAAGNVTVAGNLTVSGSISGVDYGAGNAALSAGAVGTYAFAGDENVAFTIGSTYSGASLSASSVAASAYEDGSALTGTWRAMGTGDAGVGVYRATLFLRIA